MSLEGSLPATRLLLEHTGGRPAEAPVEADALDVRLPTLRTAADCSTAIDTVIQARLDGRINSADAQLMNDLITTRLKAIEAEEHERRLTDLEVEASRTDSGDRHAS
ncbi:MAG: hypothetical protein R3F29_03575 [Planctomycetota bacterium]